MNAQQPAPRTLRDLMGNPYLGAEDLRGQKVTLKIASVPRREEMLDFETGEKTDKPVVRFERTTKALILNRTNGECIKAMFGPELTAWVGRRVTFFEGAFNGKPCVRVWGSPDLERDMNVSIRLPGRRPAQMQLHKVAATPPAAANTSEETK